ncbi:MAG: endolytic transglycosylase MltG [Candidatus Moranbacteria bacterium]|nr:endolytic transglycosylase MltG [Candidatus Moranbacteria bacterium]
MKNYIGTIKIAEAKQFMKDEFFDSSRCLWETENMNRKKLGTILGIVFFLIVGLFATGRLFFSAPQSQEEKKVFIVNRNQTDSQTYAKLKTQGLIKNKTAFRMILFFKHKQIEPGGYNVSKYMNAWQIADKLVSAPDMKWVIIREGLRKEEIGEILASTFGWSNDELVKWNTVYTKMNIDYVEGTYFPDTYLIPVSESGLDMANRMTRRFDEQFAPYIGQFAGQNIKWTTGLKLASIVQREAGGKDDMPLIAGIFWNRLNQDMNLEIDATVQYARGKTDKGWWMPIKSEDITNIDSPYNTYKYKGLPPYPIDSPGIDAIEAVLHPAETDCLYYLHDSNRQIHCSKTYEEHQANIDEYLK